ncbi:hypothetical protein GCM10011581_26420 [Saccharopolyspora subtropica]|uniref:Uncharacterized protein n=1 Tax=Saccharopolyspora thermophila TaxID=89367 RepID=A0A917NC63_9PSEU|nr:hypothetical protein [Saccharopolyspora subtropica]GGI88010.1 hypothetical protein GCM10011581_26420 [Saccharopolyspora subtropica]
MARDADRDGSAAGASAILKRIDPFVWLPVVPLLLLAVVVLIVGVPELAAILAVGGLLLLGFDLWVNSRKRRGAAGRRPARRRDDDDLDLDFEPAPRTPSRRSQQRPAERAAMPRASGPQRTAQRNPNAQRNPHAQRNPNIQRAANPPQQRGANPPRRTAAPTRQAPRPQQRPAGGRPGGRR